MPKTKLGRWTVHYDHAEEYHRLKREIFNEEVYGLEIESDRPVIIDVGAHIGLSTLYFKQRYPQSQILALEPNPDSFRLLETNIWENGLEDVIAQPVALAGQAGQVALYRDSSPERWFSTASLLPGAWNGQQTTQPIMVTAQTLAFFVELYKTVDLLKLDVEGAELAVLRAARHHLNRIRQLVIEVHPQSSTSSQPLVELLQTTFKIEYFRGDKKLPALPHDQNLFLIRARLIHG